MEFNNLSIPEATMPENGGNLDVLNKQIQLMELRGNTQFAMTPAGQALKKFEVNKQMGSMYAHSTIVPETYSVQGIYNALVKKERKNGGQIDTASLYAQANTAAIANCAIAVDLALRMNADPMMVMQNLYIVSGRPAWSSAFLIATVNECGRYAPLKFRLFTDGKIGKVEYQESAWEGGYKRNVTKTFDGSKIDNLCCIAYTTEKGKEGELLESSVISCKLAVQEGWWTKDGSKWPRMTEQMLRYRAAAFWVRTYAPELSMGFRTDDETNDIIDISYQDADAPAAATPVAGNAAPTSIADIAMRNAKAVTAQSPAPEMPAAPEIPQEAPAVTPEPKETKEYPQQEEEMFFDIDSATGELKI